jgi:SAM-dependent methyltransferase
MVMNPCPLCDGQLAPDFQVHGYTISKCASCGHRTTVIEAARSAHIAATYGDDYFSGGAAGYDDYLAEGHLLRERGRDYGRLVKRFAQPGRVLDVGAAAGFILKGFQDEGWKGLGVEPNSRMAEYARTSNGMHVECAGFEDFRVGQPFDVVSIIQVIAHFLNPSAAVAHAAGLLAPGGLLLVETWDRESRVARLFGKSWHEYSPPSVVQWFSQDGLSALCGRHGLNPVASGRPKRSIHAGHAASLIRYKMGESLIARVAGPVLGLIPKGLTVPYPGDDLFWAIFRKS